MTHLTHPQVRALLQAAANKALPAEEQALVDAHLAGCNDCRAYAQSLDELQDGLRRVMRRQWDLPNAALPIRAIKERSGRLALQNRITMTAGRLAVVPLLAFAFILAVRMIAPQQFTPGAGARTAPLPQTSSPTPTPAYRSTATELTVLACDRAVYIVRENDTLDDIAARYGVPKEAITAFNGLASDTVAAGTRLIIPLCGHTPTGTSTVPAAKNTSLPLGSGVDPSPTG